MLNSSQREPALFRKLLLCDPVILGAAVSEVSGSEELPSRGPDLASGARRRRAHFPSRAKAFAHFRTRRLFADFTPEALALYVSEGCGPSPDGGIELKCRPEVEAAVFSVGGLGDMTTEAHKSTAEVLFLHASKGNFSRERYDALAGRMLNARVESLDAGHLFPMEEPARVLAYVDQLMATAPSA